MRFKKTVSLILGIVFLSASIAFADVIETITDKGTFSDIDPTDVEILYLAEVGVVQGYSDGTVQSEESINRAETLTVFSRMLDLPNEYDASCTFTDVDADVWYAGYVSDMCNIGVIQGYPDGTFQAANQLNRAEAITILIRSLGVEVPSYDENLADDIPEGVWYADYANYAIDRNLVPLFNGDFGGEYTYTRGDLFINVYRLKRLEELGEYTYDTSMDPTVIIESAEDEGRNNNVTFEVTGDEEDAEDYINSAMFDVEDRYTGVELPMSYEDVMYNTWGSWRSELEQSLPFPLRFEHEKIRRKDHDIDYDYDTLVKDFFNEMGVNIDGQNIEDEITEEEWDTLYENLKEMALTLDGAAHELQMYFNVVDENEINIQIAHHEGADIVWLEEWDEEHEEYSKHNGPPDVEVAIYNDDTDELIYEDTVELDTYHALQDIDDYAEITVEMNASLEDGITYRLEMSPLLLERHPLDECPAGINMSIGDYVYLSNSEFTFENGSVLEFIYSDGEEQIAEGIAIDFDVIWQSSWSIPLDESVALYDTEDALMDMDDEVEWTVLEGNGYVTTDENGFAYYEPDGNDSTVTLEATYKGFTEEITVYMVESMGV